jgi:CubicO group peptidase (beta-lactamase class C family)
LEKGIKQGFHLGAQLHVVHRGEVVVSIAMGEARPGVAMKIDSIVPWYSAGKPLTAAAIVQLHERGLLDLEAPVAEVIAEFADGGKEAITFKHLLTHTAGIRSADKLSAALPWAEMIQRICETPIEEGWVPGEKAGYSTQAAWFILAESIQRVTARKFDEYLRAEWLEPLEMRDSWLRVPFGKMRDYGERLALMYDTSHGRREPVAMQDSEGMSICRPGASARGPIRELANFYTMLLAGGRFQGRGFLQPESVEWLAARHREGLFDHTFMHKLDFGLGVIVNSNRYGENTVPYGYGLESSDGTFGHSGAQSSCAFVDPERHLIVAWAVNGQPGERAHQSRQREINNAIYRRLAG